MTWPSKADRDKSLRVFRGSLPSPRQRQASDDEEQLSDRWHADTLRRGSQTAPSPLTAWPSAGGLPAAVRDRQPAGMPNSAARALPRRWAAMLCQFPLTQAAPWAESTEQVLKSYKTDLSKGLTDAQVTKLRAEYGTNELDKEEGTPLWKLVLQQFDDLLVKILLGAALLSFVRPPARSTPVHARPTAVL